MTPFSLKDWARTWTCSPILFSPVYQKPGTGDAMAVELETADCEAAGLARAFLQYYRGDYTAAAVEARRLLATDCRFVTALGAGHLLSLEALYLGDTAKWEAARKSIVKRDYATDEEYTLKEINLAALDCSLFVKTSFPAWFREGCFDSLPLDCYGFARYLYAKLLFIEMRFTELAAVVEPFISQSHAEKALMSEIYLRIIAAMGRYSTGESERSEAHLRKALELALPDRLISPFAEYRRNLGPGLDRLLKEASPAAFKDVLRLNGLIQEGWTKLYNGLYGKQYTNDLTAREYDVAKFALFGMTNAEIADSMRISVNTVKLYLRNVYDKLGVNRRDELAPFIWDEERPTR